MDRLGIILRWSALRPAQVLRLRHTGESVGLHAQPCR